MVESKFLRGVNPEGYRVGVPYYLDSLDAMHEAVMSLPFSARKRFRYELQRVMSKNLKEGRLIALEEMVHSTARQQAEAFLRAGHLWDDQTK